MHKKIPVAKWLILLSTLWIFPVCIMLFGWAVLNITTGGDKFAGKVARTIMSIASFPSLAKQSIREFLAGSQLVRPNIYPDISGLQPENSYIPGNYVLMSVFDKSRGQSIINLLRLSDQKMVYTWVPDFNKIKEALHSYSGFLDTNSVKNIRIVHPSLLPDGTIVFNDMGSPLIKIDRNSKVVWVINGNFHHSVERDADGNIWSPAVIATSKFLRGFLSSYKDDAITEVSPEGKVLFQKSVGEILYENGYRGLLLGAGEYTSDLIHLNDIQPALKSSKYWQKGDLLVSARHRSTVFLYRPSTNKILWLKTGPWLNQHDVDFIDSARIGVFGNNVVRTTFTEKILGDHNEEYIYDFNTGIVSTPYTTFLKKAKVSTITEGRSDILPNGDIFIEETNNNRMLKGTTDKILWQYVPNIDKNNVSALSWSRFITKEEFKKLTFLQKNNTL